jgi:hypothetical protein
MTIPRSVAEVLDEHVTLECEGIDRMYLNLYVPGLQHVMGVVGFLRVHRGATFASSALLQPISQAFVEQIRRFVDQESVDLVDFRKGQRKDDIAKAYLERFDAEEGVLFVGRAQEKATVFRTEKRRNPQTGKSYPWIVRATAMVNHFYFYVVDDDFGPMFIKFGTYFPYTGKVLINGHEYLKRQLTKEGIGFEALDNGVLSCDDPQRMQAICDSLDERRIDAVVRKWLARLPHPYTPEDRAAGYRYDLSVLQAEFSLTQVLDRPLTGRVFFEQVIRDNLDVGRPDRVALIFDRQVRTRGKHPTPGVFRTRVITQGVTPSLHVDYKHSRIKQYHKEGRALRTETTINDAGDFKIGKRLHNLPVLREVGFSANRRLLDVQRTSCDPTIGQDVFASVTRPNTVGGQRVAALRFDDPRVLALFHALVVFRLLPHGFANRDLRQLVAPLLGIDPSLMTPGMMTYNLRRLRLHGLIERISGSHRYQTTPLGLRVALFFLQSHNRLIRPGLTDTFNIGPPAPASLQAAFQRLETAIDRYAA